MKLAYPLVRSHVRLLATLPLLAAPLGAQSESFVGSGDADYDNFGWTADGGADIDGDGLSDVVVGGYRASTGRIKVFSGLTGATLLHIVGAPGEGIGFEVAFVDDLNSDGTPDILASSIWGQPHLFSGADGSTLMTLPHGGLSGVSGVPDQNGDGLGELRIGAQIFSGANGVLLRTLGATGDRLVLTGDINGDGVDDYIDQYMWGLDVYVRSGVDGSLLNFIQGDGPGFANGVGDINLDGFEDYGVSTISSALPNSDEYRIYSGADNSVLYHYPSLPASFSIGAQGTLKIVGMDDVDGDGHPDFAFASSPPRLYSGATGCLLAQFVRSDGTEAAFTIANAGDVDGDGDNDLIAGNPIAFGGPVAGSGSAAVFTFDGAVGNNYCLSLANSTGSSAIINTTGSASIAANNLILVASSLPANKPGLFFYGDGQVQLPLGNGLRCVGTGTIGTFRLPVVLSDTNGCLTYELDNLSPPFAGGQLVSGAQWNFQAWFRDTAAGGAQFNLSDGTQVTFTP